MSETTDAPGGLMRLVADGLAGNGFDADLPGCENGRLSVISPSARCALTVEDDGSVVLEWSPVAGGAVDPLELADRASALLTGRPGLGWWAGDGGGRPDLTLKDRVGRELQARGLQVELEVYPDEVAFEALTAIVASAPGAGLDAEVCVTDNGWLSWECDYGVEAAICWEPDHTAWIADPGKVAGPAPIRQP